METGEGGKKRWGTWHLGGLSGERSRDKGGALLSEHPRLPKFSKTAKGSTEKNTHKRVAEKPETGMRKKEMSDSLKSHYDE